MGRLILKLRQHSIYRPVISDVTESDVRPVGILHTLIVCYPR